MADADPNEVMDGEAAPIEPPLSEGPAVGVFGEEDAAEGDAEEVGPWCFAAPNRTSISRLLTVCPSSPSSYLRRRSRS